MKVGLLGAGRLGSFHAEVLAGDPGVDELLVGDADEGRAEEVAGQVGGKAAEIGRVIEEADAVVIAAATTVHAELVGRCLDRGVPIFCEKPLAPSYEETLEIVERVEDSGASLQMGFQRRFDRGYVEARRLIDEGALGTLYSVRMAGHDPEPPHEGYIPQSGGIFRDLHIHDFDILRWLTSGEVEEVYAQGSVRKFDVFAKYEDVDTSAAFMRMKDGVLVVMTGGRHDPLGYDIRMEVFGSGDSIAIGLDERTPLRSVEPGMSRPDVPAYNNFIARFDKAYRAELAHFLRFARGEAENLCAARDALEALRVAIAADTSMKERRPVLLEEIG